MSIPFESTLSETMIDLDQNPDNEDSNLNQENFGAGLAPQATKYAMSIVRRWCDAEEIVQEAFCRLIQSSQKRKPGAKLDLNSKALLFTTIRNLAIDQLRTNQRRKFEPVDTGQIANQPGTDQSRLEILESGIEEIFKEMPRQWSESLQLKINAKLSYSEIAKTVGGTHAQVRSWIYRARKKLSEDLRRRGLLDSEGWDHE